MTEAGRSPARETILFIGFGRLASAVARSIRTEWPDALDLGVALVRDPGGPGHATDAARELAIPLVGRLDAALARQPTLAIELAGPEAVREHVPPLLAAGVDVIVTSVVALVDADCRDVLLAAAEAGSAQVIVPPGAIAGLDGIVAGRHLGLDRVRHEIRKAPNSLLPADEAVAVTGRGEPVVVFAGSATDAGRAFPGSVNVAAALGLAGLGSDRTEVTLVADPAATRNLHRIEAFGRFGRIEVSMENERLPGATSGLIVVGSVLRAVERRVARLVVD